MYNDRHNRRQADEIFDLNNLSLTIAVDSQAAFLLTYNTVIGPQPQRCRLQGRKFVIKSKPDRDPSLAVRLGHFPIHVFPAEIEYDQVHFFTMCTGVCKHGRVVLVEQFVYPIHLPGPLPLLGTFRNAKLLIIVDCWYLGRWSLTSPGCCLRRRIISR